MRIVENVAVPGFVSKIKIITIANLAYGKLLEMKIKRHTGSFFNERF